MGYLSERERARVFKLVRPRNRQPQSVLNDNIIVLGKQAHFTDYNIYVTTNMPLADGIYRLVGNEFITWPEDVWTANDATDDSSFVKQWPELNATGWATIPFPREALATMVRFGPRKVVRELWDKICIRQKDIGVELAATDQYALNRYFFSGEGSLEEGDHLISMQVAKILLVDKTSEQLRIVTGENYLKFQTKYLNVIAKRYDMQYYNTNSIVPKRLKHAKSVDIRDLRSAVKSLKPFLDNPPCVKISKKDRCLTLSASNPDEYLERSIELPYREENSYSTLTKNVTVVMLMSPPEDAPDEDAIYIQHKYLEKVCVGKKDRLYFGQASKFGATVPVVFSSDPFTGEVSS